MHVFMNICILFISIANKYSVKLFSSDSLVVTLNIFFYFQFLPALYIYVFLHFACFSWKLHYWSTWKNLFQNHFFAFFLSSASISINGFKQAFWLNLMALCTFLNNNTWFNAGFEFLTCITYSSLSCKFAPSFSTF